MRLHAFHTETDEFDSCNSTLTGPGTAAAHHKACLICEHKNEPALSKAGCTPGAGSKLSRFCGGGAFFTGFLVRFVSAKIDEF